MTDPERHFEGEREMSRALAGVDWANTPVGSPSTWPAELRTVLRILLTSRFSMWMGWGPELTFFYNDAYRRDTLGVKHPWALGRPAREVWAEIWPDLEPRIIQVMSKGSATWDEALLLILERSGFREETYHTFSYSPIPGDAGEVMGLLCVVTEETERVIGERRMLTLRRLSADLAEPLSEQQVLATVQRCLSENLHDLPFSLVYLLDDAGVAHVRCFSGTDAGDSVAPAEIDPDDDRTWPIHGVLATGDARLVEDLGTRFDRVPPGAWSDPPKRAVIVPLNHPGLDRPLGVLVAGLNPLRPFNERNRGFVNVLAGQIAAAIAGARAFETERRRAEALTELDRAKTAFFSDVSHELRTPLTLMTGPLRDAMHNPAIPERVRADLEIAHRGNQRLLKLVNTLLEFARMEAGRVEATFRETNLALLTRDVASAFRSAFESAGLSFDVDCPDLPQTVFVDRDMWEKIVSNLLSNALKFTFSGSISLRLGMDDGRVRLHVQDTGIGIAPEDQAELFQRFHRVRGAQGRTQEGSGIGLALVLQLARIHGGDVSVRSEPGVGSEFVVDLPTGRAHLPDDRIESTTAHGVGGAMAEPFVLEAQGWMDDGTGLAVMEGGPGPPAVNDPFGRSSGRILVADDNADMRAYLARLLGDRYSVEVVADGFAALNRAGASPPDLIVSDVMMPGLGGLELVRRLRAQPSTAHTPVLLLSARAGEEAAGEGLAAGADDYLVKPFSPRELLARVGAHLELGRARRRIEALAEAGDVLTDALDFDETVPRIAKLVVSTLADFCVIDVIENGRIEQIAAMHRSPARADFATDMASYVAPLEHPHHPVSKAIRTREVQLTAEVDDGWLKAIATNPEHEAFLRSLEIASFLAVPLVVQGKATGGITFGFSESLRRHTPDDVRLARELAGRFAIAMEAARLVKQEHETAVRLQRGLLPARLESAPGIEICARYETAEDHLEVGGDWYDSYLLPNGRLCVCVGDVVGHGLRAATVMGQLRTALAVFALTSAGPAEVLQRLDEFVERVDERYATVCYAEIDPEAGEITYACAGHPPPLLVDAAGHATYLTDGRSPPLLGKASAHPQATGPMPAGSTLVLYSDGLVERRGQSLDERLRLLEQTVEQHRQVDLEMLCDVILTGMATDEPRGDDLALLCVRLTLAPDAILTHRFHASPRELAPMRRTVAQWAERIGIGPPTSDDVKLAVSEACANAIEHAYLDATPGDVEVTAANRNGIVELTVRDFGRWREAPAPGDRGRGLTIIQAITKEYDVQRTSGGTVITMLLPIGEP